MTRDEVLEEFRVAGALLEGHFILSSGLRSPFYLQCARVMMDPRRGERLCRALAEKVRKELKGDIDIVVSPAMGGMIVGYEMGRQLGVPAVFLEREEVDSIMRRGADTPQSVKGDFALRRGFEISPRARCLLVEDVVTTGLSIGECLRPIESFGASVIGIACLIDRFGGQASEVTKMVREASKKVKNSNIPTVSLVSMKKKDFPTYTPFEIPEDLKKIPAVKPGSRPGGGA